MRVPAAGGEVGACMCAAAPDGFAHGAVPRAIVHWSRPRVVALVLAAYDDAAAAVAQHATAVDSGADAVRVRVKAVRVCLARASIASCHPRCEWIVRYPHLQVDACTSLKLVTPLDTVIECMRWCPRGRQCASLS